MAVYTVLERKTVSSLVRDYSLGRLSVVQGVPAGSVNTHYYIEAAKGKYVLAYRRGEGPMPKRNAKSTC